MAKILYAEVDFRSTRKEKFEFLAKGKNIYGLDLREIAPDKNHTWLTEGMQNDWEESLPMGSKEGKAGISKTIFLLYSRGVATCRDAWVYNSSSKTLKDNVNKSIEFYNEQVFKYSRLNPKPAIDDFVTSNDSLISWSEGLKLSLGRINQFDFNKSYIRYSIYRPFYSNYLYFNKNLVERRYQQHKIFPTPDTENENLVISLTGIGWKAPFYCLMSDKIVDIQIAGNTQCFPFYTYNEDGTGRRENITDWALEQFRSRYGDAAITKWDIFYYIYGALHKPDYRTKYAANLRRELPRIPFYEDFRLFAEAGKKLAELHVGYESQPEYYLQKIEAPGKQLDWRVEKMRLSKDKTMIIYNDFLTLAGIPREAFEYKLGNRSALDWIIDQYQVKTDKRSGIVNDPNRPDEPDYIVRLIGKIITVSLETMKVVKVLG